MGKPTETSRNSAPAAERLRVKLESLFEVGDLESLCFDLGLDYDSLPGDGKPARVVKLIEYFSRTGHIIELIDRCALLRPAEDWAALRSLAVSSPEVFRPAVSPPDVTPSTPGVVLNVPADRALKYGIGIGVVAMLLLLCAFSGGLVASRFVNVSLNPVPVDAGVGAGAVRELIALQAVTPGVAVRLTYDNIKATSFADQLAVGQASPISEIHVQFLEQGDIALNTRIRALGNRRVVTGYSVRTVNGRLILTPEAAVFDLLQIPGTSFGWIAIPVSLVAPLSAWLQQQADAAAKRYSFESILVQQNRMQVIVRVR